MKLHELSPAPGSNQEPKRKGRGIGTGNGKTAGRGHKGQWARSGGGVRPGFEGGQMPLARRLPKRGFNNKVFAKHYAEVNVAALNAFEDGETICVVAMLEKGLIGKKLTVKAAGFSKSAKEKIEAAGGKAEVV